MKRMTRRQVDAWLSPVRAAFNEFKTGEVMAVDGHPVTHMSNDPELVRTDYCISGFLGLISRVLPDVDLSAMYLIRDRLADDEPMTTEEVDAAFRLMNEITKPLMLLPLTTVMSAVRTEQIAIEIDALQDQDEEYEREEI